jgi:glycosyltransferase involved in cell wall biosynthesis
MKILNFSSHYEDCGIAKYQENYLQEIESIDGVESTFFSYSPYQTREMDQQQFQQVIQELENQLSGYDIFHIQHEFGFFLNNQLELLVKTARNAGVKVVVTYHTSPDLIIIKKRLAGFGPRNILSYLRSRRHNNKLIQMHIAPLIASDKVIAHNQYTAHQLAAYGVPESKIAIIAHPTYGITHPEKTTHVADSLQKKPGDIILSTIGYIHRFKGVDKAIKALSFLPDNYKLAILGGVKSDSDDQKLYDELADLIIERGVKDRVYISGVVESDADLNSYIRETDLSLYPYDSVYYKGVASGALNLAIANERPIVAYPVSTLRETNTDGHLVLTKSDSYYELAHAVLSIDLKEQKKKTTQYALDNSWKNLTVQLLELYKSIV